jgi:CheY-like chemotaxis protein
MPKCSTILVVEDDEGIRSSLQLMLEYSGYKVETAANGKQGLERLSSIEQPCLILLDLMMPVMDGWAFAEVMKKDMTLATIPIVVVTAFADKAESIGASRIVKKPVEMDTLLRFVQEYCV